MADRLRGTWVIKDALSGFSDHAVDFTDWNVNFSSNGENFDSIGFAIPTDTTKTFGIRYGLTFIFYAGAWQYFGEWTPEAYRTLVINSNYSDVENADELVQILTARAESFAPYGEDIVIPLSSPKGVILRTAETKCESDIVVIPEVEELTVTANGEYAPTKVGFSKVIVEVESEETPTQEKTIDIAENGSTEVTPDEGYALSKVNINVNVEASGGDSLEGYFDGSLTDITLPTITTLKTKAFYNDTTLINVIMPNVTSIEYSACYGCSNLALTELPSGLTSIENGAFYTCTKLALTELPSGLAIIGPNAFYGCSKITLTELPSGVTSIGASAFYNCGGLTFTELPSGVTIIERHAFYNCSGLTALTFKGTPKTIASGAFYNCANLATINVPWAEGAVANAPWGATNATINYNYTGE